MPELRISVARLEGYVAIDFVDNGAGIDPASRALIFEKFSRVPGQGGEGAGLGLAICREIITRLQGDIVYLADGPGTGFRVTLPIGSHSDAPDNNEVAASA
jgi:signal transduction histidine kinase